MVPAGRTALVTGASGYIGGQLATRLHARGYRIRALVRPTSDVEPLQRLDAELVFGDIREPGAALEAARGADVVFHLAGLFRHGGLPDAEYRAVHVGGTRNMVAAVGATGAARLVHVSTIGVHGSVKEIPTRENSPFNPGDIYQETKLEAERLVQAEIARGLPAVVARPAGVYGPGDLRHLKLFKLLQRGRFVMFGSGRTLWHPVYIEDLLDGLVLCAEHPDALRNTYILPGPRWVTLDEWIAATAREVGAEAPSLHLPYLPLLVASIVCEAVCKPLGISPPLHRRRATFFVNNRAFSFDHAREMLGFAPRIDIAEGLARTADWYRAQGMLA